jgi:hypothetical protein
MKDDRRRVVIIPGMARRAELRNMDISVEYDNLLLRKMHNRSSMVAVQGPVLLPTLVYLLLRNNTFCVVKKKRLIQVSG